VAGTYRSRPEVDVTLPHVKKGKERIKGEFCICIPQQAGAVSEIHSSTLLTTPELQGLFRVGTREEGDNDRLLTQ